jgi:hypothetical protein
MISDVIHNNRTLRISIYDKSIVQSYLSSKKVFEKNNPNSNLHGFLGIAEIEPELINGWEREVWLP